MPGSVASGTHCISLKIFHSDISNIFASSVAIIRVSDLYVNMRLIKSYRVLIHYFGKSLRGYIHSLANDTT